MRPTLFYLPERFAGLPLFGWGWGLILWGIFLAYLVFSGWRRRDLPARLAPWFGTLATTALLVVYVAPMLERMPAVLPSDALPNHGVPIRGYGVMLALAASCGVGLAARRAPKRGFHSDVIYGLAVWMAALGILGARVLFVVQHLENYRAQTLLGSVGRMLNIAEGGLVVYGSLLGAGIGFLVFTALHHLPRLSLADVIAPSLALGLAIGRLGCFLNGCCWGGLCDQPWKVTFPQDSPPYMDHYEKGWLWGLQLGSRNDDVIIAKVLPGSAAVSQVSTDVAVNALNGTSLNDPAIPVADRLRAGKRLLATSRENLTIDLRDGKRVVIPASALPARSLPIHPTQIYSALGAFALFLILLAWEPFARRDGELIAVCLTIYPLMRFVLESIRDDEPGWLGTSLTLAQHLSLALGLAVVGLWIYVARRGDRIQRSPRNPVTMAKNRS